MLICMTGYYHTPPDISSVSKNTLLKWCPSRSGEISQRVRARTTLLGNSSLVPSTHHRWLQLYLQLQWIRQPLLTPIGKHTQKQPTKQISSHHAHSCRCEHTHAHTHSCMYAWIHGGMHSHVHVYSCFGICIWWCDTYWLTINLIKYPWPNSLWEFKKFFFQFIFFVSYT